MERYNSFHLIHKGLRAALYQTALHLQQTDFTSEEETEDALDRVREVVLLFDGHAHKEDQFILPAICDYEPSVVATFQAEHVRDEALGEALKAGIERRLQAATAAEKIAAGNCLTQCFTGFMVFNLEHMAKEEDIINKVLWRYYNDDEIRKIVGQIQQSTPPWMQDFYSAWMLRGINNAEAVSWMKAIEQGAPPIVFRTVLQKAKQVLPRNRFHKLSATLAEELQPA